MGLVAAVYFWTRVSRITLFWSAFVLTRPQGAAVGDFIDKPVDAGGLEFSRYVARAVLIAFIDRLHRDVSSAAGYRATLIPC